MELLVQPGDEKASRTLKLFIFLEKILICLFSTNIRDLSQKKRFVVKNKEKNGGKQTKSKIVLENRQSENFCLTYFSKPDRDPIEKSYTVLKTPTVTRGGGAKKSKQFPRIRHDLSLGFDVLFPLVKNNLFFEPNHYISLHICRRKYKHANPKFQDF